MSDIRTEVPRLYVRDAATEPNGGCQMVLASAYDALAAENAKLREALTNLYAMVLGECPSILEDDHHSDMIRDALAPSVQPSGERT